MVVTEYLAVHNPMDKEEMSPFHAPELLVVPTVLFHWCSTLALVLVS